MKTAKCLLPLLYLMILMSCANKEEVLNPTSLQNKGRIQVFSVPEGHDATWIPAGFSPVSLGQTPTGEVILNLGEKDSLVGDILIEGGGGFLSKRVTGVVVRKNAITYVDEILDNEPATNHAFIKVGSDPQGRPAVFVYESGSMPPVNLGVTPTTNVKIELGASNTLRGTVTVVGGEGYLNREARVVLSKNQVTDTTLVLRRAPRVVGCDHVGLNLSSGKVKSFNPNIGAIDSTTATLKWHFWARMQSTGGGSVIFQWEVSGGTFTSNPVVVNGESMYYLGEGFLMQDRQEVKIFHAAGSAVEVLSFAWASYPVLDPGTKFSGCR